MWVILAIGAAVLATVFGAGVGVPRARPAGPAGAIVRWGHALVWVFLSLMFLALAGGAASALFVAPLGLVALATYVRFLATLFRSAKGRR